jgi:murein DD-endopeptidase MepM/ murein hydrolase activator NlpD
VTSDGRIELHCGPCARGERTVAAVEAVPELPATAARSRWWVAAAGATVVAGAALAVVAGAVAPPAIAASAGRADRPDGWDDVVEPIELGGAADGHADRLDPRLVAAAPRAIEPPPIPERDGEPIDEWLPTLRAWVHPVPGSPDVVPNKPSRRFGADRDGVRNRCGGGHCGVDLDGVLGQPVVAVAWGTVVKVQRDDTGLGGRYVRIEHPDFVYTVYFHLDRIAPGLRVGDEVDAGEAIGTLGRTGIRVSLPHLHFALELPEDGAVVYADPEPFLARAEVLARDAVPEVPADHDR